MSYQAYQNEIELTSALLIDENGNVLIDIAAENISGKIALDYIVFNESISSPVMDGSLVFTATKGEYESLQLIGNETLKFIAKTPEKDEDEDENQITTEFPDFSVYSFEDSSNFTDTSKTPEGRVIRTITLKFCTKEAKQLFEKTDILPRGFIGKISTGITFETGTGENGEEIQIDNRGLVEILSENLEGQLDTEETLNYVWIRPKTISSPTLKRLENMNFLQMLNYCKDYAVSAENPNAVNYFFWHDLDGWHFKSADKMLYEVANADDESLVNKQISTNIPDKDRIYKFDVISDFNEYEAISNKLLYSYYYRIEPDYISSVYARLMDDREKYNTKKIVYNYAKMFNNIYKVEPGSLYPLKTEEELNLLENESLRINDVQYGWLNSRAFNDNDSVRSILLLGNELFGSSGASGASGESGPNEEPKPLTYSLFEDEEEDGISGESKDYDLAHFDAYEPKKWQEMFDCVSLDAEPLKKIIEEIKLPTFEAKKKYRDKLAYKEQWNIYKYSVCCTVGDEESDDGIMAVIKNARVIGKSIYRYSWHEVVFVPKIELANFAGATFEVLPYNYGLGIDAINATPIGPYPANFTFKKYRESKQPEVIGDLTGEIFVGISGGSGGSGGSGESGCSGELGGSGISFEWSNSVTRALAQYFNLCEESSGVTLTFHNDRYSPFLIVEKPNGARGSFENYTGAYNLNEIMNRATYEYPVINGASAGSSLYYQELPYSQSEAGDIVDRLVGPGINTNPTLTEYPAGFASMPIGSYQLIGKNEDGTPIDGGVVCSAVPIGYVTKISSVKISDLPNYGIDTKRFGENSNIPHSIYYFAAVNAQDGKCGLVGDCGIGDLTP